VGATQFHADRHEGNCRFLQFCESAQKEWENVILIKNLLRYNKLSTQTTPGNKKLVEQLIATQFSYQFPTFITQYPMSCSKIGRYLEPVQSIPQ
jgi:hypothetical protein